MKTFIIISTIFRTRKSDQHNKILYIIIYEPIKYNTKRNNSFKFRDDQIVNHFS